MRDIKLRNLPPYAKLFVGMTTVLMLGVVLWSIFIFYVDKGLIEEGVLPDYAKTAEHETITPQKLPSSEQVDDDVRTLAEDSLAELAPIWDSMLKGENAKVDSASMRIYFPERDSQLAGLTDQNSVTDEMRSDWKKHLRENVGLAHTHQNGQTLLYFVLGFFLMFTSVPDKRKKILLWLLGIIIFTHTIGLSGEGFHWFFDDLLAVSGVGLLVLIPYYCFLILIDLSKSSENM